MPTVDYLPVATSANATVDTQAIFDGSGYQLNGFQNGIADPAQANKVWRQASMIGNAVATFISNTLGIDVLDDGNSAALIANLTAAIAAAASGIVNGIVQVPFDETPVFNAALGSTFEITLTGNVRSSTIENILPGQRLKFIIHQDSVGSRTFVAPTKVPMTPLPPSAPNVTSMQNFFVDGTSIILQDGPLATQ
jgi:hypothetical protein